MYTFFQSNPDIALDILLKLNPSELGKLGMACKAFKDQIDKTPKLWQHFLQDDALPETSTISSANSSSVNYKEHYINHPEHRKPNFLCYDLQGICYLFTQIIFMQKLDNWKGNRIFKNLLPGIVSLILASQLTIEEAISLPNSDTAERLHNAAPLIKKGFLSISKALQIKDQISLSHIASSQGLIFYLEKRFYTFDELMPLQYKEYAYLEAHAKGIAQNQFSIEQVKLGLMTLKPLFIIEEAKTKSSSTTTNTRITKQKLPSSFNPTQNTVSRLANNLTFQHIADGFDLYLLATKDLAYKVQEKTANAKCNTLYALEYLALLIDHKVLKIEEIQPILISLKKDEGIKVQITNRNEYRYR